MLRSLAIMIPRLWMLVAIVIVQFAICILMSGSGEGAKVQSIVPDLRISPPNEGNMVHEIKIISRYAPETGKKKDT